MTVETLIKDYQDQANHFDAKIAALKPLLCVYSGDDLYFLRRKIKLYYDMSCECKRTAKLLAENYDPEEEFFQSTN